MNLKDLYSDYQHNTNKLSAYVLITFALILLLTLITILAIVLSNIIVGAFAVFTIISICILYFCFIRKILKQLGNTTKLLACLEQEKSCIITKVTILKIPKIYNIVDMATTKDGFKLYKCKNQDQVYSFLEQSVENVDDKNNMLTLIKFCDLKMGTVVTVEYIMQNNLCVVKDEFNEYSLNHLENISLKGEINE